MGELDTLTATAPSTTQAPAQQVNYGPEADGPVFKLIRACIEDARANHARKARDRQDWRNLLFYRGGDAQWTVWDKGTDRFVERGTDPEKGGLPDYIQRCVTNVFANKIDGIAAILNQAEPAKEYSPATDDDNDAATAEVAQFAVPVLLEEIGYTELKARATPLVCLTDKVVLVPYYETDAKHGTQVIPDYQCVTCGVQVPAEEGEGPDGSPLPCPTCQQPLTPAMDPETQEPIGPSEPVGKICCELVPGFEVSLPKHAKSAHLADLPWILFHTRMSVDAIERRWPAAKGLDLTRRAGASGKSQDLQRTFADGMMLLSSPQRADQSRGGDGLTQPVVYRLMHDPIDTEDAYFPDGLYVTMVDDQVLEATALPVTDDQGRAVKNAISWQFQAAPGTAFGKPPADDLVPLQETRNVIESLALLILMHNAAPRTWIPLSVSLENEPTGAPGENTYYRSTVPGEKPTTESSGLGGIDGCYKQIELIDQKMDELSRLNAVLQGARPEGGNQTLGEIQILQERGMSAFKPSLDRLVDVEKQLCQMLLWIARDSVWSSRFTRVMGENGAWDVKQFIGADLDASIDVQVNAASAWPKSPLMQRMMVKEAFAMGLFPPAASDPELAEKLLSLLNLAQLKPSIDLDRKQVARKLDRWKEAHAPQEIQPPNPAKESLPVHFVLLTNFLKTEEYENLETENAPVAMAMLQHVQAIGDLLAQRAAAQAAAQAGPAAGGKPGTPPSGHDPLNHAVQSGALKPAGGQPPKADPLDHAIGSGALQPAGAGGAPGRGASVHDLEAQGGLM